MNSIINNIEMGNNSMLPLSFHWTAKFNDGTIIEQFGEDGIDNNFKIVKERFIDLKYFQLHNQDLSKIFTIDLEKGIIKFCDAQEFEEEKEKEIKNNIRLIYFRRHQRIFNGKMEEVKHVIIQYLGYQYQDIEGKNRKVILKIDENGKWVLGE